MSEELHSALDDCIERLRRGASVEECLRLYPEQAGELEPLLRTAQALQRATAFTPSADVRRRHRLRLMREAEGAGLGLWGRLLRRLTAPVLRPAWAVSLAVAVLLLGAGWGTVSASANATPDQPLYPVKRTVEKVRLMMARDEATRARIYASLASERLEEARRLAREGKVAPMRTALRDLRQHLERVRQITVVIEVAPGAQRGRGPTAHPRRMTPAQRAVLTYLAETLARQKWQELQSLKMALQRAPSAYRPAIMREIQETEAEFLALLQLLVETPRERPSKMMVPDRSY